jgi:hypothetical protein
MNGAFSGLMYINNSLINLIKCRYSEFLFRRLHNKFYCVTNRYKVYFSLYRKCSLNRSVLLLYYKIYSKLYIVLCDDMQLKYKFYFICMSIYK